MRDRASSFPPFHAREKNESDYHLLCNCFSCLRAYHLVQCQNTERKKPDGIMTGQTQKGQLPHESVFGLFKCSARQARLFCCNRTFKRLHNGSSNTIGLRSQAQNNRNGQSAKNKPVISGCIATMARMGAEECLNRKSDQSALGSIPRRVIQFFNPISTCCAECSAKAEQPHGKYTWLTGSDGFPRKCNEYGNDVRCCKSMIQDRKPMWSD